MIQGPFSEGDRLLHYEARTDTVTFFTVRGRMTDQHGTWLDIENETKYYLQSSRHWHDEREVREFFIRLPQANP